MYVVNNELAHRIEAAEAEMYVTELEAVAALPGNPYGAQVRRFGNAIAVTCAEIPRTWLYNRIFCAGPGDEAAIDEAAEHFHSLNLRCRVDVSPLHQTTAFMEHLAARGFTVRGFQVALFAEAAALRPEPLPPGVTIRTVHLPDDVERTAEILATSFGSKDRVHDFFMDEIRSVAGRPDRRLYLALVDGTPAGAAALHVAHGVGSLEVAGTLPAFRGRGAQTALLHCRIADARELGCDLIVSQTGNGTVSQNNMERVGLRIAYTKAELYLDRS